MNGRNFYVEINFLILKCKKYIHCFCLVKEDFRNIHTKNLCLPARNFFKNVYNTSKVLPFSNCFFFENFFKISRQKYANIYKMTYLFSDNDNLIFNLEVGSNFRILSSIQIVLERNNN